MYIPISDTVNPNSAAQLFLTYYEIVSSKEWSINMDDRVTVCFIHVEDVPIDKETVTELQMRLNKWKNVYIHTSFHRKLLI